MPRCEVATETSIVTMCHVFAETAASVFVNRPLVNGTGGQIAAFELVDEHLLVLQQVELVAVQ